MLMLTLVLAVCSSACKEKYDGPTWQEKQQAEVAPILEEYRDQAKARLELIKQIGKAATDAPRVSAVSPSTIGDVKLVIANDFTSPGDTVVANIEWAVAPDLDSTSGMKFRLTEPPGLRILSKWVATSIKAEEGDAKSVERKFTLMLLKKYALILRVYEVTKPSTSGLAGGKLRYSPGRVVGDAQLFDIATAKSVGAFPFDIVQSGDASVSPGDDEEVALSESLRIDVLYKVRGKLETLVAGGEVQDGDGAAGAADGFKEKILFAFNTPDFLTAFVDKVEFGEREGSMLVTIYAMTPSRLEDQMDKVKSIVAEALGVDDAIIEIKKSADTETEPKPKPE
jgi:hypothetical protein